VISKLRDRDGSAAEMSDCRTYALFDSGQAIAQTMNWRETSVPVDLHSNISM
jgi:hypothetical protein